MKNSSLKVVQRILKSLFRKAHSINGTLAIITEYPKAKKINDLRLIASKAKEKIIIDVCFYP